MCARGNSNILCNVELVLGLTIILLMLDDVHLLIKFSHGRDIYICDFVATGNSCQGDIHSIFIDEAKSFEFNEFHVFNDFILEDYDFAPIKLLCNLNTCDDSLGTRIGGAKLWMPMKCNFFHYPPL